jgi:RNA polymerase sigma-70 factor, ECF subfamily
MMRGAESIELTDRGEKLEFAEFFHAVYPRLATGMYLLTGDRSEAEDASQEAMARVYERWDRVRGMDSPEGYVYRTALNLYRKRLRRRRPVAADPPGASPDPADAAERRALIRDALRRLTREQREALVLVEWLDLPSEEAGAMLGISAESVRARVHRAKAALRERLIPEGDGDG